MRNPVFAFLAGIAILTTVDGAIAEACSRPETVSVQRWNLMSADQQDAACRLADKPQPQLPPIWSTKAVAGCSRPPTTSRLVWNSMSADAQIAACRVVTQQTTAFGDFNQSKVSAPTFKFWLAPGTEQPAVPPA